jgi:hypothetical protein
VSDEPTISRQDFQISPWDWSGYREDSPPPHRDPADPPEQSQISLHTIWSDKDRVRPIAAKDYDGCRATILWRIPNP